MLSRLNSAYAGKVLFFSSVLAHHVWRRCFRSLGSLGASSVSATTATTNSTTTNTTSSPPAPSTPTSSNNVVTAPPSSKKSGGESSNDCACSRRALANTVKSYQKHVIVCGYDDPETWSSVIEDDTESFAAHFAQCLKANKLKSVKMSGCTRPNSYKDKTDVIVYPDDVIYHVNQADIDIFVDVVLNGGNLSCYVLEKSKTNWSKLILICIHGNRDKRCGVQGRETYSELLKLTEEKEEGTPAPPAATTKTAVEGRVQVYGSTHLGGHEFAGTCCVYPESNWYGYLSRVDAKAFLQTIEAGEVYKAEECFRGKGIVS